MGVVDIDRREGEAAQIKFVADLKRREQIVVLGAGILVLLDLLQLFLDKLDAVAHHALVESALLAAAVEIGRVECKRLMHLEPRNAEGHHDIRRRVGLREEILDLFARADVPFRHAGGLHLLLRAVGQTSALSDGLHDLERPLFGHAALDEIQHDIVAAADGVVDGGGLGQN